MSKTVEGATSIEIEVGESLGVGRTSPIFVALNGRVAIGNLKKDEVWMTKEEVPKTAVYIRSIFLKHIEKCEIAL